MRVHVFENIPNNVNILIFITLFNLILYQHEIIMHNCVFTINKNIKTYKLVI